MNEACGTRSNTRPGRPLGWSPVIDQVIARAALPPARAAAHHDPAGEDCGTLSGKFGMLGDMTAETDGIGLVVRGAEPCEIAEEVATAFLLDFSEWLISDDYDFNAMPYETDILGWQCNSGSLLNPLIPDPPLCVLHNAEIELTPP